MAIKISTCFNNRIPSPDLIFRDAENQGVNLIYYPELGNTGTTFINKYRKKNYWDYVVIPPAFLFLSHKVFTNNYLKDFKKSIPQIRVQRKFTKNNQHARSVVIDLTPLSENFSAFSKSKSRKLSMDSFIELIEKFIVDSDAATGAAGKVGSNGSTKKAVYLVIDASNQDEKEMVSNLLYWSRLNSNKITIKGLEGILLYGNKRFWPLTIKDQENNLLKVNINIFARFMKDVHSEDIEEGHETKEESIQKTKEVVKALYKVHESRLKATASNSGGLIKKAQEIEEDPVELIKSEVIRNKNIPGNSFEEKLSNLFKPTPAASGELQKSSKLPESSATKKLDKEIETTVKNITEHLDDLNKKYNGVMTLNENNILQSSNTFYKPLNIIGFKDFNAYQKQKTEFGDNLDQAMFDLLKSLEADKNLGIRVLNIQTVITNTNRDRLKTYKIKIQHKKFGHRKPYTVSLHVPIPSKGRYLKLGGNSYIMINQFYAKPIIKVSPKMVRFYTQWATCAVSLKHHALNDKDGVEATLHNMSLMLKHAKKLKRAPQKLETEEVDKLVKKWNLPESIDSEIFTNFEIKE